MDLTVSMVRIAGGGPPRRPFDGLDVLHHLEAGQPLPSRSLFWRGRRGDRTWRAVRDGDGLKYVSLQDGGQIKEYLYDLARDPNERVDLSARRPEDVGRLKRSLVAWEEDVRPRRFAADRGR